MKRDIGPHVGGMLLGYSLVEFVAWDTTRY